MRAVFATLIAALLVGCSEGADAPNNSTMDLIERQVQLPEGAASLDDYARYYAHDGNEIVAIYISRVDPTNPYYDVPRGQRRWLADHRDLPLINDGGCSVVSVRYNPVTRTMDIPLCNGEA
jgi:hypothetical protein